ncbi:amidohydrolase family protein [Tenggerimyces flavus]|uniref:Amidohydrolase family protein n=1 Tax=Tenggerimyces flavus TaxID=1708749 RepID=A0ABV7YPF0_9ACTN|nr:amidohydrolase family protein [Tenggerimyces flavus]
MENGIDTTAFLGQWPWRLQASADAASLGVLASRVGVSSLWVSHLASIFGFDTRSGNEALFDAVETDDRLVPFAILNPDEPTAAKELAWAVANGARGVRLTPGYHGYQLSDPSAVALVAAVGEMGLPLHVCARLDDERLRHRRFRADDVPLHELAELVRSQPRLPMVLSGLKATEWDEVRAHVGAADLSNVVVDLWFVNGPVGVIARLDADQYAFGSATPVQSALATAAQLATAAIPADDLRKLSRGNAERVLADAGA